MNKVKFTKKEIEAYVKKSFTIADVCRLCGWQPRGDNYKIIKRYIKEYDIDISHFTGKRTNIGNRLNKHNEKNAYFYLHKNSYIQTNTLKRKIFEEGIKDYKCELCGISEWNGKKINLQLHHINGDNTDNSIENLQILCPNCHSQTDNFCGKNHSKTKEIKCCEKCGTILKDYRSRLCPKCANIERHLQQRKVERPTKDDLFKMIKTESFESIGRKYNVCGKTIKKWCIAYGLPSKRNEINKLNNTVSQQ